MKRKLVFLFLIALIAGSSVFADAGKPIKQKAVFGYCQTSNNGSVEGWIIDSEGNVKTQERDKPLGKIDKVFLDEKRRLIKALVGGPYSERKGSEGKEGLRKIYFCYCNSFFGLKRRKIILKESGDFTQINNNENAKDIISWLEGIESGIEQIKQLEKRVTNTK
ncbi:MAG: hypothetical protein KKH91_05760 [Elusimicrobia bacterium]|nr:hypothetical protein [Elusimicrobiota bacterium]MBU2614840.1 hypothetical protein [Elusimicrobiota bacterium]